MLTPLLVSLLTDQALITMVVVIAVVLVVGTTGLVVARRRRAELPPAAQKPAVESAEVAEPKVGDDAEEPRDTPTRTLEDTELPEPAATETIEKPESAQGRLVRLRARLARSQGSLGKGLLALLSRDKLDEEAWEDIETTLITADVGVAPTQELVEKLRTRMRVEGVGAAQAREILREELIDLVNPSLDRALNVSRKETKPAVVLVVGVNGTGKTTTVGKLARVLVAEDKHVVLGAADTFRAAAADQLQTWGERVGVRTVRGPEGGDPASIAFDSVKQGIEEEADVVLVDTAGRLHTKTGLMDELGKVKRVIEKSAEVDEVLLVIDATTGQNGLTQARVFAEVINVTGLVLTKLDGTAKGGIVIAVQRELGVPVKLVGLGEGPDDLAPFDPEEFVDALLD
ncbi:signal recognition particle-docking protein FtsY [Kribbella sp. VKM Ac-2566]|nr:signal recognition particle-docking protein FtsY [Kribbella sp. VKM Ac-2566]